MITDIIFQMIGLLDKSENQKVLKIVIDNYGLETWESFNEQQKI